MKQRFIYIHGFASSPSSSKAKFFKDKLNAIGYELLIPDLNQNNFSNLTLSRQIRQVNTILETSDNPVTLIGSSLGGLTSALLAEKNNKINRLILLAPAFNIKDIGTGILGQDNIAKWKATGVMEVFHYGEGKKLPLNYSFAEDLELQNDSVFYHKVPTIVFHGTDDNVVPISVSRKYAQNRKWVKLIELESDHSLENELENIWSHTNHFIHNT